MSCQTRNNWGQTSYQYLPTEEALFRRHNDDCNAHGGWIKWSKDILQGNREYARLFRPLIFDTTQNTALRVLTSTWSAALPVKGGQISEGITFATLRADNGEPKDAVIRFHGPSSHKAHIMTDGTISTTESYFQVFGTETVTGNGWNIGLRGVGDHHVLYNVQSNGTNLVGIGLHSEEKRIYFLVAQDENATPFYVADFAQSDSTLRSNLHVTANLTVSQTVSVGSGHSGNYLEVPRIRLNAPNSGWDEVVESNGIIRFAPDRDQTGDPYVDFLDYNGSVRVRINTHTGEISTNAVYATTGKVTNLEIENGGYIDFRDSNGIGARIFMDGENLAISEPEDDNKRWLTIYDDSRISTPFYYETYAQSAIVTANGWNVGFLGRGDNVLVGATEPNGTKLVGWGLHPENYALYAVFANDQSSSSNVTYPLMIESGGTTFYQPIFLDAGTKLVFDWDTDLGRIYMGNYGSNQKWLTIEFGDDPGVDRLIFNWFGTDGHYKLAEFFNNRFTFYKEIWSDHSIVIDGTYGTISDVPNYGDLGLITLLQNGYGSNADVLALIKTDSNDTIPDGGISFYGVGTQQRLEFFRLWMYHRTVDWWHLYKFQISFENGNWLEINDGEHYTHWNPTWTARWNGSSYSYNKSITFAVPPHTQIALCSPGGDPGALSIDGFLRITEGFIQIEGQKTVTGSQWYSALKGVGNQHLVYNVKSDGTNLVGIGLHSSEKTFHILFADNETTNPYYAFYISPTSTVINTPYTLFRLDNNRGLIVEKQPNQSNTYRIRYYGQNNPILAFGQTYLLGTQTSNGIEALFTVGNTWTQVRSQSDNQHYSAVATHYSNNEKDVQMIVYEGNRLTRVYVQQGTIVFQTPSSHWYPVQLIGSAPSRTSPVSIGYAIFPEGNEARRVQYASRKDGGFRIHLGTAGDDVLWSEPNGNIHVAQDLFIHGQLHIESDIRSKVVLDRNVSIDALKIVRSLPVARFIKKQPNAQVELGLIAQDVEKVLPEAVVNENGVKQLNLTTLIAVLWKAVQELTQKITS